jgi:hypothetical protein
MQLFISGLWGVFYFKEIRGTPPLQMVLLPAVAVSLVLHLPRTNTRVRAEAIGAYTACRHVKETPAMGVVGNVLMIMTQLD